MKLWQLVSIVDNNTAMLQSIASSRENWRHLGLWFGNFGQLVQAQDRSKLDYEIPESFVRLVLSRSQKVCFLSKDGWLRSWQMSPDDELMPALDAYQKYGGEVLERVYENGAVAVAHPR